jgi:hypothetical protein
MPSGRVCVTGIGCPTRQGSVISAFQEAGDISHSHKSNIAQMAGRAGWIRPVAEIGAAGRIRSVRMQVAFRLGRKPVALANFVILGSNVPAEADVSRRMPTTAVRVDPAPQAACAGRPPKMWGI